MKERALVPVSELVDLERLNASGRSLTQRTLREALPRGWALAEDGEHAYRDRRLLFREGWILILGLVIFGSIGLAFLLDAVPDGWHGMLRLVSLLVLVLLVGGFVAPRITRALNRRRG